MHTVSVHEAKTHLSRYIREVVSGKEIIITSNGKPVVKLTNLVAIRKTKRQPPKEFAAWGKKHPLPADFDDPMPDEWFDAKDEDEFYKP